MPLSSGTRLGPYEILAPLGAGGMGEVYKARDARIGRDVAIKVAAARFSDRFEQEVRAVAFLNHPNICTLHDVGPNYLVMELVEGETLRDWMARAPAVEQRLDVARQVLEGLRAAHRAGFVHRDLKPINIMMRSDGYVKILDFGLAKRISRANISAMDDTATMDLTLPGQITGTITYMSPEQVQGHEVDARSDLFALGVILYEMLAGEHPFRRQSPVHTLHAILQDEPPVDRLTSVAGAQVSALVHRLLRKIPAERYASAAAVLEAFTSRISGQTAPTASTAQPLTSIAVLPFVFLNEVEERQALSLGFADALITILGNLESMVVTSTSAILKYAPGVEPARACRELGVRHALQGNVQKLGAQWRVSVQLFDAASQRVTFSDKHTFRLEDVFEVQDEIGRWVVESFQTRFPASMPKTRDRYTSNPEAYNEFMAGLRQSYTNTEEEMRIAVRHLARAVELDPEFALAHAWFSQVAMQMQFQFDTQRSWLDKAEYHCQRALTLDPALPEAHWARAAILWSPAKNFQHEQAIAALEQVLAAQPNFDRAHNRMAAICMHIGRMAEARTAHELAVRSNPRNRTYNLGFICLYSGDFAGADEAGAAWLKEAPTHRQSLAFSAVTALMMSDLSRAEERLAKGLELYPDEPMIISTQAMLHARLNQAGLARDCIHKALEKPNSFGHTHHTYHQVADAYCAIGDTNQAMAWLERSADTGNPCWPFFNLDPFLENLRPDRRFQEFVAALERKYATIPIRRV